MKDNKTKNILKIKMKQLVFFIIVLVIAQLAMFIMNNGKICSLEGYLYSLAAIATGSDATSCDATSSDATSSDATSSNATSCDAPYVNDATCSDATSSNVPSNKVNNNKVQNEREQHLQEIQEVVKEEKKVLGEIVSYKNEEINAGVISEIEESEDVKNIIINADKNSKISSDIFMAIKNTDKQLTITYKGNEIVFKGKNITNPRSIDVAVTTNTIINDKIISGMITSDGIVVNFEPNGALPGIAKIRIKATSDIKKNLNNNKIYAYFYDETNSNFMLLSENVKLSEDGFYEFAIEHNSKYVLVNEKVDEKLLAGYVEPVINKQEEKEVVSFLESHKAYIFIIGMCVVAIVVVSVIIIIDKKGIKKRHLEKEMQENNDIPKAMKKDKE